MASQVPGSLGTLMSLGQVMAGGSTSLMVTVKEHWAVLGGSAMSDAVQVMVVTPTG